MIGYRIMIFKHCHLREVVWSRQFTFIAVRVCSAFLQNHHHPATAATLECWATDIMWAFTVLLTYLWLPSYAVTGQPSPVGEVGPSWGTWSRLFACCTERPGCSRPETSRDHIVPVGPRNPANQQEVVSFLGVQTYRESFYVVCSHKLQTTFLWINSLFG